MDNHTSKAALPEQAESERRKEAKQTTTARNRSRTRRNRNDGMHDECSSKHKRPNRHGENRDMCTRDTRTTGGSSAQHVVIQHQRGDTRVHVLNHLLCCCVRQAITKATTRNANG